jgi:hypothetical protein
MFRDRLYWGNIVTVGCLLLFSSLVVYVRSQKGRHAKPRDLRRHFHFHLRPAQSEHPYFPFSSQMSLLLSCAAPGRRDPVKMPMFFADFGAHLYDREATAAEISHLPHSPLEMKHLR